MLTLIGSECTTPRRTIANMQRNLGGLAAKKPQSGAVHLNSGRYTGTLYCQPSWSSDSYMVAKPEYVEAVVAMFAQATEANWNTAGRVGSVIELEEDSGEDVLITGDLHGHRKNFTLIRRLADLDQRPRRHLILQEVCHGGPAYPNNGGCMSHAMLEEVAKLKAAHPDRVHFLLSNHELAEATDFAIVKSKRMLNLSFRLGLQEVYGQSLDKVRKAAAEFILSCPLGVRLPGDVFVCHSAAERCDSRPFDRTVLDRALDDNDVREGGPAFDLVWGRDYRPENGRAFARAVGAQALIHGHEPCPAGSNAPNDVQLILDCCGDRACYLLLPLNRPFTHAELVAQVKLLG